MPKVKKSTKSKNKKHSNVVPIRKDLKTLENEEKILSTEEVEEQERKRTNVNKVITFYRSARKTFIMKRRTQILKKCVQNFYMCCVHS